MNAMSLRDKVRLGLPFLQRAKVIQASPSAADLATMARVVQAAGDRIKVAGDILSYPEFFQPDASFSYDDEAFDKRVRTVRGVDLLRRFQARLQKVEPFDAMTLERVFHEFVDSEGIKIGQIIHAVRVAVTGKAVGFGLFEGMAILGRDACLARIARALGRAEVDR